MNKVVLSKAILDGLLQSIILNCLGTFLVSTYCSNLSLKHFILIGIVGAIISAIIYIVFVTKMLDNKSIICFSLIGIFFFVLCIIIIFVIRLSFKFEILPLQKVNNAYGILLIYYSVSYMFVSIVIRVGAFVIMVIKNTYRKTHNT